MPIYPDRGVDIAKHYQLLKRHANLVREAARIASLSKDIGFLGLFGAKMWKRTVCGMSVQV